MSGASPVSDPTRVTVREVMKSDVVTVRPDTPVSELVALLEEERISGVPVVDADGVCVGVVSATDVNRAALGEERRASEGKGEAGTGPYFRLPDGPGRLTPALPADLPRTRLGARAVREIMTPATFSVRPEATLPELARFLVRSGIHRALVYEGQRLAGIVTAMDVLRSVGDLGE